jgi:hypothetical protein
MCMLCDGASQDEVLFHIHGVIHRYGWFIQYVQHKRVSRSWAYTIGMASGFDHPELVIAGVDMETASRVVNQAGEMVERGARLTAGTSIWVPRLGAIRVSAVHRDHFDRGVFAVWDEYHHALGPPYPPMGALELVLPGERPQLLLAESKIG